MEATRASPRARKQVPIVDYDKLGHNPELLVLSGEDSTSDKQHGPGQDFSGATGEYQDGKKTAKERIVFRLLYNGEEDLSFALTPSSEIGRCMRICAGKYNKSIRAFYFVYKKRVLNYEDTPKSLGMQNGDVIEMLDRPAKITPVVLAVFNIPYNTNPEDISSFFSKYSRSLKNVRILTDRSDNSTGIALATFLDFDEAQQALEHKNQTLFLGNVVEIQIAPM